MFCKSFRLVGAQHVTLQFAASFFKTCHDRIKDKNLNKTGNQLGSFEKGICSGLVPVFTCTISAALYCKLPVYHRSGRQMSSESRVFLKMSLVSCFGSDGLFSIPLNETVVYLQYNN